MRAVALSLLGHGPDVDDALQDAALVALRRIGDVRDPAAVGAWLRMVVRNACRMRLRAPVAVSLTEELAPPSSAPTPEQGDGGARAARLGLARDGRAVRTAPYGRHAASLQRDHLL
jgi:RNA polymerase sigma-70 factor (ECF subfamily)